MSGKKPVIKVTPNGPFIVKNISRLEDSKGRAFSTNSTFSLCRCGKSHNKPFCDGTHTKISFNYDKSPDRVPDKTEIYKGKKITIYDNRGVCAHRGPCTEELPSVFGGDPFVRPDAASPQEIIKIIKKCPSGALSYALPGEERNETVDSGREKISLAPRHFGYDGGYDIKGYVELDDPDGNIPERKGYYCLCRCGESKNKPFCSGHHWHVEFLENEKG